MATINIGSLTFTHKGDYASGTAYVKNDVVYYSTNGNAYIAKQATTGNAPTNATYWNQFAQGSGGIWNAGLSLGSAGQVVKVNSGASALEFGTISSDYVKIASTELGSDTSYIDILSCFSSTYKNYKVFAQANITGSSQQIAFQFITGSNNVESGSNYRTSGYQVYRSSSASGGGVYGHWDQIDIRPNENITSTGNLPASWDLTIYDPSSTSKKTHFAFLYGGWGGSYLRSLYANGYWNATTAVTGIRLKPTSGSVLAGGFMSVYGIK